MLRCLLLFVAPLCGTVLASPTAPRNCVIILADDLGYGDVGVNGSPAVTTPNLDRFATEGLRFTSGYSSASTCTPTRYSLLTGTHALRVKGTHIAPPNSPALIPGTTPTLATLFRGKGFATAIIGKWHLGLGIGQPDWNGDLKPGPLEGGFDHSLILPTTADRVPSVLVEGYRVRNLDPADPIWVGDRKPTPDYPDGIALRSKLKMDWSHGHHDAVVNGVGRIGFFTGGHRARFRDENLVNDWLAEISQWLTAHKDERFFLLLTPHNIHVPRLPNERFAGKSPLGPRGDVILEFDWYVGQIMRLLQRLQLDNDTLVILTSDNGPVLDDGYQDHAVDRVGKHRVSGPFRGGKYSVYEGGTRLPFFVRWPGHIRPGVSDAIFSTVDLPATLAALIGATLPDEAFLDSFALPDALLGAPGARGREWVLQQDNTGANLGLRQGPWKLIHHTQVKNETKAFELYYLTDDPGERSNLAASHPTELASMKRLLAQVLASPGTRLGMGPDHR